MRTYIHERSTWPALTWDGDAVAGALAQARHKQGRLLGRMGELGFDLRTEAGLSVLTSEVVTSSAIEGEMLNPEEVRSSIARRLGLETAGLPRAGRDVEGIVEMMLDATQNYGSPLTEERLFAWHSSLFPTGRSGMHPISVGTWRSRKSGPMQVVSGALGKEKVHFEAPEASRLPGEMQRFLVWFNKSAAMDPVLKAAIAHFWFVTIHPFEDGNGRIARAIADMALAKSDDTKERFYSMSAQIEAERKTYYEQLESAQKGDVEITPWILWFLECLGRAIDRSENLLVGVLQKARVWQRLSAYTINERQRIVINRLLGDFQGFLTTSKYAKLAKCSHDTANRDMQELLELGVLARNPGRGRSTSYKLADDL